MGPISGIECAKRYVAVTKSDTVGYSPARALYVGTTGDVVAVDTDGNTCTFTGVPGGTILPVSTQRVNSTNTTASNIVALY